MSMQLKSGAFKEGGTIHDTHARQGGNISPPLTWDKAPKNTRSFALIVEDPDAPSGTFVHWLLYDIPPDTTHLDEDAPPSEKLANGARQGRNDFHEIGYGGPQPPSGTHRYLFHLFALDSEIPLPPGASRKEVEAAIRGHVIEQCRLVGTYQHR